MKTITDQLLDNAPCGYLQINAYGGILRMNNTLRTWLGFEDEATIKTHAIEDLFNMGGKIYFQTHMLPLLKMQEEISEINITMIGRDAVQLPVLINAKKDEHQPGEIDTFSVFVVNFTQRKMYESELLKERKKAENATEKLKQVNRDLEQFAYTASHDLQSPLRTISAMIQLLEKKEIIERGSEGEKLFSFIKTSADQMRMMVKDLLEYSKVDNDRSKDSSVSLKEVIYRVIDLLKEDVKENRVVFDISEMPVISVSKSQLSRLFQNLFENSIKYRSEKDPVIVVTQTETDDYYNIHVKDNGIGFNKEQAKEIFSFMNRLPNAQNIPGTGIGLAACQRIMKHHGGLIKAESQPGEGALFILQFPK